MKQVNVSEELYDRLKDFVVDPFDDTLETVVTRLVDVAQKAKDRWVLADADGPRESAYESSGSFRSKEVGEPGTL